MQEKYNFFHLYKKSSLVFLTLAAEGLYLINKVTALQVKPLTTPTEQVLRTLDGALTTVPEKTQTGVEFKIVLKDSKRII